MVSQLKEDTELSPAPVSKTGGASPCVASPLEGGAAAAPRTLAAGSPLKEQEEDLKKLMRALEDANARLRDHQRNSHREMKGFLENLLEILDGFERIFANLEARADTLEQQTKRVAGNFRFLKRVMEQVLTRVGVAPIEVSLGTPALPALHKIVEVRAASDHEEYTILEVVKTGYSWDDEILRHPEVVVVQNAEEASSPDINGDANITVE